VALIDPNENAAPTADPLADPLLAQGVPPEMALAPPTDVPPEQVKSDEIGYRGGLPVDLDRVMKNGQTLRDVLTSALSKELEKEIENHRDRIEAIGRWNKLYAGVREAKNYPYAGANNIAIPFTMYETDTTTVRLMDAIWSQKKLFIVTGRKPPFTEMALELEDGLDWWQSDIVKLKSKLFSPLLQAIKIGTSFGKMEYVNRKRTACRYAKPEEVTEGKPGVFKFANGTWGIKDVISTYEGPDFFPISREDAVWSSNARTIQDARLFAYRMYRYKPEIEVDSVTGKYYPDILSKLGSCDDIDETKVDRAADAKLNITSGDSNQYAIWENYYRYDVDEDGEEDDLVISYHRASKTLMSCIYNPTFSGHRPIVRFVFNPMEYSIEGKGIVEILEGIQQGIDFYHNARLDRLDQINNPITLIQSGSGLDDFVHAPGTKWITEALPADAMVEFIGSGAMFPPSIQEEQMLATYGEKAAGGSPATMGQSVSERPVARETIALLQEANKKFKFGIDNIRDCIAEVGMMALEQFAQFQPTYKYFVNQGTSLQSKTIDFPLDYLRDGCNVRLTASSEMLNTEVRQQMGLTAYQLLSDYYTKTAGMVQALVSPGLSPAFKQYLMMVMMIGGNLLRGILEDMGMKNAETLMPELEKNPMLIQEMIQSSMMPPPPPPGGPEGGNGEGPPGEGGEPPPPDQGYQQ
jgi:hypothetical protein